MIDIKKTAQEIVEILEHCGFDDITDSSGYYVIKEFEDGTDRVVDVHKSTDGDMLHYVIYCSFEDEQSDWVCTEDLSIDSLIEQLENLAEIDKTVWLTVYKDTIKQHDDDDNLVDIQVTEEFAKQYFDECVKDSDCEWKTYEEFMNNYTADDTEDFYEYANKYNAILDME